MAKKVLHISHRPFVRWDTSFGQTNESQWWYVLKRGKWDLDEQVADKKKRWMVRQGRKNFTVRPLTHDEVLTLCPSVAEIAANRNELETHETRELLETRLEAEKKAPGSLEYIGCFSGDKLVSFSENHTQDNAVFMAYFRQDPAYLKSYSSYALVDGILEYYLNNKNFAYVLDGSRSIHHRTSFQDVLTKVFSFQKEYALLHVVYSKKFAIAVKLVWPFRKILWKIWEKWPNPFLDNISAILRQEAIRRDSQAAMSANSK